jgi:dolichyl-phosphate-mannose-protein mannosyltransferase
MSQGTLSLGRGRSSGFWSGVDSIVDLSTWKRRAGWLIAAMTLFRLTIIASTALTDTEAYYYVWSRFPSLSYYDHPPLVAWMTTMTTLVSTSAFFARLGAVACSALLGALVYRLAARLFSARAGFITLVVVVAPPTLFATSFLVNPEAPLAPLWVLALLLLDDLVDHDEWWRPLVLGLVIGIAFLAKYTGVLLVPVALLFLATSARTRRWFRRPSLYASGFVALAAASPVVLWNARHGWPSVKLHLVERVAAPATSSLGHHATRMVLDQVVIYQPLIFPLFMAALYVSVSRARKDERYRLLSIASVPVLLFLSAVMLRIDDAEPHWTMVGFLPLAVAAGGWLDEQVGRARRRAVIAYLRVAGGFSVALFLVFFVHTQTSAFMRLVPPSLYSANLDPVNEAFGWDRVTAAIEDEAARLGPDTVVAGAHNVLCGQVAARLDDRPAVYCPSPRRTEFDFLGRRDPPADAPVVYVDSARYHEEVHERVPGRRCEPASSLDIVRGGRTVSHYDIYGCQPVPASPSTAGGLAHTLSASQAALARR